MLIGHFPRVTWSVILRLVSGKGDVAVPLLCVGGGAGPGWGVGRRRAGSEQRILGCILTRLPTHHPSQSLFRVALSAVPRGGSPCTFMCLAWPEPAKGSVLTVW